MITAELNATNEQVAKKLGWYQEETRTGNGSELLWKRMIRVSPNARISRAKCQIESELPDYSRSIAAAWEIVEHCKKDVRLSNEFQWALFEATNSSDDSFEIFDITALAICQAFLKIP